MKIKTKICTACKQEKPITAFRRLRSAEDGLNSRCKECCDKSVGRVAFNRMLKGATATTEEELLKILRVVIDELRNRGFEVKAQLERKQSVEL